MAPTSQVHCEVSENEMVFIEFFVVLALEHAGRYSPENHTNTRFYCLQRAVMVEYLV